ncbi:UV DNA damage repair endonuclease UvsE [Rufibacter ruber]|uniref:UV DNA damage repair endonuclease UvsE n=1 Tax=Rufibacter ruber TaxID=1783499 RepID=UPI0008356444|nr:UV DNA damage repair endonuclease UvsE [Rufibacter ruber]
MKIGYPCVNESLDCSSSGTFRLASYSEERLVETVEKNLACLRRILEYNLEHGFLFFRMSSGLVPFASHAVNTYNWQEHFKLTFRRLGDFIKKHGMRISMHPDQFVVLNSPDERIVRSSIAELVYQGSVMDLMGLDATAKLQIHAGGVYGDKPAALKRFIHTYQNLLPEEVKARLVVENDDRLYSLRDCLELHGETGIPILFDNFHHECLNQGEPMADALQLAAGTWHLETDGVLMMDYSSQSMGERKGKHTTSLDTDLFREFLTHLKGLDVDIMLEIKDKEASCLRARQVLEELALV